MGPRPRQPPFVTHLLPFSNPFLFFFSFCWIKTRILSFPTAVYPHIQLPSYKAIMQTTVFLTQPPTSLLYYYYSFIEESKDNRGEPTLDSDPTAEIGAPSLVGQIAALGDRAFGRFLRACGPTVYCEGVSQPIKLDLSSSVTIPAAGVPPTQHPPLALSSFQPSLPSNKESQVPHYPLLFSGWQVLSPSSCIFSS